MQLTKLVLEQHNIEYSHIEAKSMLCHVLNQKQETVYAEPNYVLSTDQFNTLSGLVHRRLSHEPLAYLTGRKEFYSADLFVNNNVLIPRPETEMMVEEALKFVNSRQSSSSDNSITVADIGTGSGAIAIGIALNANNVRVYATDISADALKVARINIELHNVTRKVILKNGDLLEALKEPVDLIVANLPYIKRADLNNLDPEIRYYEPIIALDGGIDGLACIKNLLKQAKGKLKNNGCILLEIDSNQADELIKIIEKHYPTSKRLLLNDFNGLIRVIKICL